MSNFIFLSPHKNFQHWLKLVLLRYKNESSLILLKHRNIIKYRSTADTVHVDVYFACIEKEKRTFWVYLNLSLYVSYSGHLNNRGDVKMFVMSTFLTITIFV